MSDFLRRTFAEINLDYIAHNYNLIKSRLDSGTKIMAVVKADAYGHGVEFLARELLALGADMFAVSNIEEALQLRGFGITLPILIAGHTPARFCGQLADNDISQTVVGAEYGAALSAQAKKLGVKVKTHLKIDSGMGRVGFVYRGARDRAVVDEILGIYNDGGLIPQGIFTHFAVAESKAADDARYTTRQYQLFVDCVGALEDKGLSFELRHCSNSAAVLNYPQFGMDMVRPGISLYGLDPAGDSHGIGLKPAFCLKSVIALVKTLSAGECISYGRTYTTDRQTRVATIPIGYGDGFSRALSNRGFVMINGRRANILGRVCMDQIVVDVSDIPGVAAEQEVLIFGECAKCGGYSIDDYARALGTISYEVVCGITKRVPRVFIKNKKIVGTQKW